MDIKQTFEELGKLVEEAKTEQALNFLNNTALKEKAKYNNLNFKPSIRKKVLKYYQKIKKAIIRQKNKLK